MVAAAGRTLIHVMNNFPGHRYTGIDVDSEAIAWCRNNLHSASFKVNLPKRPLDFAEASFDLIYGISVFTHIDRASEQYWLAELYRLLRPGGVLLLTC
ncbi:MAG: class I SAM-dependent methyltransferase [Bryobacteraceae bacterium]